MEDFFVCRSRTRVERQQDAPEVVEFGWVLVAKVQAEDGDAAILQVADRVGEGGALAIPVAQVTSRLVREQISRAVEPAPLPSVT